MTVNQVAALKAACRKRGMTIESWVVLNLFVENEGINLAEAAELAGITSGAMTGKMDALERRGMIRRVPSEEVTRRGGVDRRKVTAKVTAKGRKTLGEIGKASKEVRR